MRPANVDYPASLASPSTVEPENGSSRTICNDTPAPKTTVLRRTTVARSSVSGAMGDAESEPQYREYYAWPHRREHPIHHRIVWERSAMETTLKWWIERRICPPNTQTNGAAIGTITANRPPQSKISRRNIVRAASETAIPFMHPTHGFRSVWNDCGSTSDDLRVMELLSLE